MRDERFLLTHILQRYLHHVTTVDKQTSRTMDTFMPSGVIARIRRFFFFTTREAVILAESVYNIVVFRISELSPGGRVRLRFIVYLTFILSLNYFSTVGMTSSTTLLQILSYNDSITKLTLTFITGYLFVTYISQKLNLVIRHMALVTIPSMFICLLDEDILWKAYRMTFCSFVFLMYVSSIVPRQDTMGSIGPVTVIVSMSSMYMSLLLYIVPALAPDQWRICQMAWYFGILLAASGLIIDDLQVVMGSSGFPFGLVKRRARKYAYVIFVYYLVLYYSIAKLLSLQKE